jgi:anaerobic selenocysteine-containing dehydrogenase
VLISADDAARLGVCDGAAIELRSPHGEFTGRVHIAPMRPGNLEVHWPEGNVLLSGTRRDPASLEPDYNIEVTVSVLRSLPGESLVVPPPS